LPVDNHSYFENDLSLVDWLRQWVKTEEERDEVNIRSFLGKMIFSGEEALKLVEIIRRRKSTLYDVQNDDGKSQHIDDRRAYKSLGFRVNSGI
jgi:hypothetical protein